MSNITVPVVDGQVRLTSPFGSRKHPKTGQAEFHHGIDLAPVALRNPRIFALDDGEIMLLQRNNRTAGNWIEIWHGNMATTYMHLDTIPLSLAVGSRVTRGQQIGTMGNTGDSTGIHLHFETRHERLRNPARNAIDPMPILLNWEVEEMRYRKVEDIQNRQFREFVQGMIDRGELSGTGTDLGLNITDDMIRNWMINERRTLNILRKNGLLPH